MPIMAIVLIDIRRSHREAVMHTFLEATWFLWWILTVIGVLRWFHNASELDPYVNNAETWDLCQMGALKTGAPENQPYSRAS